MPRGIGDKENAYARQRRATQLRVVARMTYSQIAEQPLTPCPAHQPNGLVGCAACGRLYSGKASAQKAVHAALARDYPMPTGAERDRYVQEQVASLDALLARAMRDALDPNHTPEQRARAMAAATRLWQRKSNLLGLDARHRVDADDALDAEIRALVDELASGG